MFVQVPASFILDGVDITDKDQKAPKDLPTSVDATRTFTNKTDWHYQIIHRILLSERLKKSLTDVLCYRIQNNSANDFTTIEANPRGYAQ